MSSCSDASIMDHLAEFLLFLSTGPSFWFSINLSYDHDCHLSKRFGMTPQNYKCILVASDLAHYHPKWGFSVKVLRLKAFFDGHRFFKSKGTATINCTGTFKIDTKKLDLNVFINGRPIQHRCAVHMI